MIGNSATDYASLGKVDGACALPPPSSLARSFENEIQQLAALNALVSLVSSSESPEQACRTLAAELQQLTKARLVSISLCDRRSGRYELVSTSEQERLDPKSDMAQALTAASQECAAREEPAHWPPSEDHGRHALLAHRRLSQLMENRSTFSLILPDANGKYRGVCTIVGGTDSAVLLSEQRFLDAASIPLGSSLALIQQARGNRFDRWAAKLAAFVRGRKGQVALGCMVALLLLALLPMRYRVKCDCELQPVVRRFIAAPFDARLEKSFVEPGDVVAEGDLLAQIDARDIQWKLSAKQAEAQRVETELAGYVAAHESGKARIAELELERIQVELDELDFQAANLEIRSPLSGMVLLGDHAKLEGVPLEKGKTLFEVAPLDHMVIEVEIPQDDVRFIEPGQRTKIRFDAFPLQPIVGQIARVHPRAEIREQNNVFVAEVACQNVDAQLRPGMRGSARVDSVVRPLVWNTFHKPFAQALIWLGI